MRRAGLVALVGAGLLAVVLLQVGLLARLPFPSATPDLAGVVVAAVAIARGARSGAICGFAAGLLLDLTPPAAHAVGQWALVLTLVGAAAGRLADPRLRPSTRIALVGVLVGLANVANLVVAGLVGLGWPSGGDVAVVAAALAAYGIGLAVVVVPLVGWLDQRTATTTRPAW